MKNKNLTSLDDFINKEYGPVGTTARDKFEAGYNNFKSGVMTQQASKEKGIPQEQLIPKGRHQQRKHFKN